MIGKTLRLATARLVAGDKPSTVLCNKGWYFVCTALPPVLLVPSPECSWFVSSTSSR